MLITLQIYWSSIRITAIFCFLFAIVVLLFRLQPPVVVGHTGRYEQMQKIFLILSKLWHSLKSITRLMLGQKILHPYSVVKVNKHLYQSRYINSHSLFINSFIIQLTKFIWMLNKNLNWTVLDHFAPFYSSMHTVILEYFSIKE